MARFGFGVSLPSAVRSSGESLLIFSRGLRSVSLAVFLVPVLLVAGWSQDDPAAGILPFSTQAPGILESVDLASSNINVQVPVRSKIGKLPFSYNLVMNSHALVLPPSCSPNCPSRWAINGTGDGGLPLGLVPQLSLGATVGYTSTNINVTTCGGNTIISAYELNNFYIADSTGAIHPLQMTTGNPDNVIWSNAPAPPCYYASGTGVTTDGSGYTLVAVGYNYTVSTAGGNVLLTEPIFTIYDRSGNAYEPGSGPPVTVVQDPDGTAITYSFLPEGAGLQFTDTLGTTAITAPYGGPYEYTDAAGNTQKFQVNFSSYTQQTVFGCTTGLQDIASTAISLVSSVTTPTGTITFTYETTPGDTHTPHYVTGRLASITYASGASVSYSYSGGNNGTGTNCVYLTPVVPTLTKTVTDDLGNVAL